MMHDYHIKCRFSVTQIRKLQAQDLLLSLLRSAAGKHNMCYYLATIFLYIVLSIFPVMCHLGVNSGMINPCSWCTSGKYYMHKKSDHSETARLSCNFMLHLIPEYFIK